MTAWKGYWTYTVGVTDQGLVVLKVQSEEEPENSVTIEIQHESAVLVAQAMMDKAAYVEHSISEAVERLTQL